MAFFKPTLPKLFPELNVYFSNKKLLKMKTHLKTPLLSILLFSIVCCTNTTNKTGITSLKEDIIINDTSIYIKDYVDQNTDTTNIIWSFKSINNNDVNDYIFENYPFLIFSLDSTFVLINAGCNIYIGECTFSNSNNVKFEKIKIKDEICPIDALEREIVYMLESSNNYLLNNNNLILFKNDYPIGLLTIDTVMSATMP